MQMLLIWKQINKSKCTEGCCGRDNKREAKPGQGKGERGTMLKKRDDERKVRGGSGCVETVRESGGRKVGVVVVVEM